MNNAQGTSLYAVLTSETIWKASGAKLGHCPGVELPADGLTKVLAATKLAAAREMLGVCQP